MRTSVLIAGSNVMAVDENGDGRFNPCRSGTPSGGEDHYEMVDQDRSSYADVCQSDARVVNALIELNVPSIYGSIKNLGAVTQILFNLKHSDVIVYLRQELTRLMEMDIQSIKFTAPVLLKMLEDKKYSELRYELVSILAKIGGGTKSKAITILEKTLEGATSWRKRGEVLGLLTLLAEKFRSQAVGEYISVIENDSSNGDDIADAIYGLGKIGGEEAEDFIISMLDCPNSSMKSYALRVLRDNWPCLKKASDALRARYENMPPNFKHMVDQRDLKCIEAGIDRIFSF